MGEAQGGWRNQNYLNGHDYAGKPAALRQFQSRQVLTGTTMGAGSHSSSPFMTGIAELHGGQSAAQRQSEVAKQASYAEELASQIREKVAFDRLRALVRLL